MKLRPGSTGLRQSLRTRLFLLWVVLVWVAWVSTDRFSGTLWLIRSLPRQLAFPWPHAGSAALSAAVSVSSALLICAVVAAAGRPALGMARLRAGWLTALGAGLPLVALFAQAWGLVGLAFPRLIAGITLAAGLVAMRTSGSPRRALRAAGSLMPRPTSHGFPLSLRLAAYAAVCMVGLAALAPQLAWDAAVHHLRAPALYLLEHKVHALPRMPHAFFPATGEMLFMVARSLGGDPAAALLHGALWLCCGAVVARLARMVSGAGAAPWAQVLFLSLPLGLVLASRAYVEFFVVLPVLLSFGLLAGRGRPGVSSLVVAGWLG